MAAPGQNRCTWNPEGRAVLLAVGDPSVVRVSLRCVDELDAIERELDVAREHDDSVARTRLIAQALALPAAEPFRAEYLDELAYAYEQLGRFDEAVDAMRKALDAGWDGELDDHPSARALIADLLLRAGRASEAERAWRETELERPRDPRVYRAAGNAYANVGLHEQAFQWRTRGLKLALELADPDEGELLWLLAEERAEGLGELDELQRRAEETIWEADREDRERAERFLRGLHAAEQAAPRQQ
jgi:tetratricopeptide (TPR) repeat protein